MKNAATIWSGMKVGFLIIGTTIGAGFASGREIYEFFASYGSGSSFFILLSILLFSLSCYIIMSMSRQLQAANYANVLEALVGKSLGKVYDMLIFLYLFSTTAIMFAGSGATIEYWSLPYWSGVLILFLGLLIVFVKGTQTIMSLNSILVPLMIMTLVLVCLSFMMSESSTVANLPRAPMILPSAIAFSALNILPLIAVLAALGAKMEEVEMRTASLVSGLGLGIVAVLYNESLLKVAHEIMFYEIPLFSILQSFSESFSAAVSLILWVAIYTTAVSGMFGLLTRFQFLNLPPWLMVMLFSIIMVPLTQFGFANLVKILYPLYGVMNLFILGTILLFPLSQARKMR